jgi:hypothetical protein
MARKRKKTGRPPKRASERKSKYVTLPLEKKRLEAYKQAADKGFKGNLAAFLRAAADALAASLGHPVTPVDKAPEGERPS